jgi:uncharacterized iron-regulated membrane protein
MSRSASIRIPAMSWASYQAQTIGSARIHQFHTHFLAGKVGQEMVGRSAVLLPGLSISGVVLWWPRKILRMPVGSAAKYTFDLHNTVGILSFVFMLIFGLTGIFIHWEGPLDSGRIGFRTTRCRGRGCPLPALAR